MAKAAKKKSAKELSNIFHNMASVKSGFYKHGFSIEIQN